MKCPECPKGLASRRKSTHVSKNGKKRAKQNYICVDCKRQFPIPTTILAAFHREDVRNFQAILVTPAT